MSYVRRVGVEVYGNVSGFLTSMGQMNAGITRTASGFQTAGRQSTIFNNQLKAIGTTARYALAGGLIFGITGALSKLSQLQVAIGNIQTVATQIGGQEGLRGVDNFSQSIINMSNKTLIPVQTLTDSITALYSSLKQNLPQSDVLNLTERFAKIARTSQISDPTALVGSILGGITAFGMPSGPGKIGASASILGDQFKRVLQYSRNMSGEEYAQYSGNLYKRAGVAGLSPTQAGALAIQSTMLGGPASTNMQNLSQFLLYLRNPKSAKSKAAYAQAGITEADLVSSAPNSGLALINKLITYAQSLPSGVRAQFISNAFGRMQSQSTFQTLIKAGGMSGINKQIQNLSSSAGEVDKSFKRFVDSAPLAQLATTLGNMNTTIVKDMAPGLNLLNKAVGAPMRFLQQPTQTSKIMRTTIEAAIGGMLVTGIASRLLPNTIGARVSRIPGIGKFLGGAGGTAGKVAAQAITAEEAANVLGGSIGANGTRANPLWVIISPLSWQFGQTAFSGNTNAPTSTTGKVEGVFKSLAKKAEGPLAYVTGRYGARAAAGALGLGTAATAAVTAVLASKGSQGVSKWQMKINPKLEPQLNTLLGQDPHDAGWTTLQASLINRFKKGQMSPIDVERRLMALGAAGNQYNQVQKLEVTGEANGTFKIALVDANGRVIKTVEEKGVPVKIWDVKTFPTAKGKAGTRKSGGK